MNIKQKQLLSLIANKKGFGSLSLRKIAELIGAKNKPQTAKYHLQQLEQAGLIQMNLKEGFIKIIEKGYAKSSIGSIFSVPVVGSANCGPATIFAEKNIDQYLRVSTKMLPRHKSNLYALIADGDSMNQAKVNGKFIENGDFVLVDSENEDYENGDIVVAVIDGMGTIKKFKNDPANKRVVLEADSTEDYLPIFLHENDNLVLSGKVVGVIKRNN